MIPAFQPPTLQKGEQIGIIAPAGQLRDRTVMEQGISILRDMGFHAKLPRSLWPGKNYLADSDTNRALEFHRMWADPEISAILALRGGFGSLRLLPFLDKNEISRHRKLLIGFSDITILHQAFDNSGGMISFHGPMLTTLSTQDSKSLARFHACLSGKWQVPIHAADIEVLRGGDPVQGRLTGGNLSSILSITGTQYDQDWQDGILFLEDIGEPLYRLDRLFTQLALCGKLAQVKGILLGDFSMTLDWEKLESIRFHEQVWERVLELTAQSKIPVWGNFPTGHCPTNMTLPHGAEAIMDSSQPLLSFV